MDVQKESCKNNDKSNHWDQVSNMLVNCPSRYPIGFFKQSKLYSFDIMVNLVFVILTKGFSSTQQNYEQEAKVQSKRDIDYNLSKEARVIKTKYTI